MGYLQDKLHTRQYSKNKMVRIFLRDGFIDRYSGEKLLFPGIIRLLTLEVPQIFKYHVNWKMSETHMIYWDLFPTIDHITPIARGGSNSEDNWITTNQLRNSAKSNFTLEELGWKILPKGNLDEWDGLCSVFLRWINSNENFEKEYGHTDDWKYIIAWRDALICAQNETISSMTKTIIAPIVPINNNAPITPLKQITQTSLVNIRNLIAGCLYKTNENSKAIYLVLSPYDINTNSIATAVINNPNANPANIICRLRTESLNNINVLQLVNYPETINQIITSLVPAQQSKVRQLYRGTI